MKTRQATVTYSQLYLRILDQFPNPVWRSGLDGKCDFFNKAWLDFTGRTLEQEMGEGWATGAHPRDLDAIVEEYYKKFSARENFILEYRLKHKDNSYHWILDYGNPFFGDDGGFLGYIGSCYDINEQKNYIKSIEQLNKVMVGRELRMVDLKEELAKLKASK